MHLAQVNVARLREPLDAPLLADFMAALQPVDAAARRAPGFVWRPRDEDEAESGRAFLWDTDGSVGMILNLSVWESAQALRRFVFDDPLHLALMRRRREWFHRMTEAHEACWWIPDGERPTWAEAESRVRHLRAQGPTAFAFPLRSKFAAPA